MVRRKLMVRNSGFIPSFRIAPSYDSESKSINSICRMLNAVTHFLGMQCTSLIPFDQTETSMTAFASLEWLIRYTNDQFSFRHQL